ncbi:ABC transporter permease [Microbulbifer hydrolyticus]|uniref:ABC transport system permease protein n=1 Tax=Microbulbifer hydrolyticus TaxID=48074 RepID=A0A6P1TBK4_9GAMM|nr:ABC transporter permease [Microbulbifer hydrolyticus]MBB5210487.1 putative ABC transport system permease protein [Microbulbifer hydrolyticus]QHQ39033.1 hypothetical protein GTQ55_08585 [Microbulbifer hydrolyticus]
MGLGSVFLSHYRRHPIQLAGLLLILLCAAALWSGVRSLTGAAEEAVDRSRAALEPLLSIVREDGRAVGVEDFARLRRAGFCASPRLEVRFSAPETPVVVGIDPFSAGCLRQYSERQRADDPGAEAIAQLITELDRPTLLGSAADLARWQDLSLPDTVGYQLREAEGLPAAELLTDISVAAQLEPAGRGTLSILMPSAEAEKKPLPEGYLGRVQDYGVEPDPLVDAFLLSLDALGALALLVAALLVRAVYRFALEQRRRSLEILVRLGVPPIRLRSALIVEVMIVALVGGTIGMWLGEQLASVMAGGFQSTVQGLFSVDSLGTSTPTAKTWLGMVLILAVVVAWACADLLWLRRPSGGWEQVTHLRWLAAVLLMGSSLTVLLLTGKLWLIFLSTLGCLIGVGLLLPMILNRVLARAERHCSRPLLEWSCSEMRALCRLLQLPLTALAFAIATTIGVHAMVTGFESTFARWLDQRLQGDLFLDPGRSVNTLEITAKLQGLPGVTNVLPMVRGRGVVGELPVDVMAVDPASPLLSDWPFLDAAPNHWAALVTEGVMINEQLARRLSLAVGDRLIFRLGKERFTRAVIGIYADYGRPEGELLLPIAALPDALPGHYTTFALAASELTKMPWRDWPQKYPWLAGSQLRDQKGLKQAANAAFDRTFQITRMLNTLVLALAGTALALMGLVIFRLRQSSYTLLHVYGVHRGSLRRRLIAHSILVTGLLAVLATPLGVFLGWVLVAKVNPSAFGWALPLHLYPGFWLQVWLACLVIGALVGVLVGNPVRLETLKNE